MQEGDCVDGAFELEYAVCSIIPVEELAELVIWWFGFSIIWPNHRPSVTCCYLQYKSSFIHCRVPCVAAFTASTGTQQASLTQHAFLAIYGCWELANPNIFFFFLGYARPKLNGQIEPSLLLPRPMNQTMAMDPLFSSSIFLLKTRGPIVSPSQQIKEHSSSECSNNFSCLISFLPSSNGTQGKAKLG